MGCQKSVDSGANADSLVPAAAGHIVAFTAVDLLECFRKARVPLQATPTLEICERLLSFLPLGRPSDVTWTGQRISPKAAKAACALLAELPAIEANWRAHYSGAHSNKDTRMAQIWEKAVFEPLADLRRALHGCKGLITPTPNPFPEDRKAAINDLHALFCEAVRPVAPHQKVGTTAEGACARFIIEALPRLGYGSVTGDAVEMHFKRQRKRPPRR
jgi:hypothetical protein